MLASETKAPSETYALSRGTYSTIRTTSKSERSSIEALRNTTARPHHDGDFVEGESLRWEPIDSREFDGALESSHDEFDAGQLIAAFEGAVLDSFNEDKRLEELLEGAVGQDGQFLSVAFMVAATGFAKNSRLTFSVGQGPRKKYGWR